MYLAPRSREEKRAARTTTEAITIKSIAKPLQDACATLRARIRQLVPPQDEPSSPTISEATAEPTDANHAAGAESVALDALRVVLQHVCLADRAVLLPMRDAPPDGAWVVHRASGATVKSMTYVPAVVSSGIAFHLAQETAARFVISAQQPDWRLTREEDSAIIYVKDDAAQQIVCSFGIRRFELGPVEETLTYLDLRTLAALRVVVGPDESLAKTLANVVALREAKMPPGGLHAITQIDGVMHGVFMSVQAAVAGGVDAIRHACADPLPYPRDVLLLAATVKMEREKALRRLRDALGLPERSASGSRLPSFAIPSDLERIVDLVTEMVAYDVAAIVHGRLNEDGTESPSYGHLVQVRPLPLAPPRFRYRRSEELFEWGEAIILQSLVEDMAGPRARVNTLEVPDEYRERVNAARRAREVLRDLHVAREGDVVE